MMEQAPRSGLQTWDNLSHTKRHPTPVAHPILCLRGESPTQHHCGIFWDPCLDGDPGAILVHDACRLSWPLYDGRPHVILHLANGQSWYFCYHAEAGSKRMILHKMKTHNRGHTDETILESTEHHGENDLTMGPDPSSQHTRIRPYLHFAYDTHRACCRHACRHRGLHIGTVLDDVFEM